MSKQWKIEYDVLSGPVIVGPRLQMFKITKYEGGQWRPFDDEEEVCQILCNALNNAHKDGLLKQSNSTSRNIGESQMPIEDKIFNALRRVAHLSTETVGDMCKDDLITLGTSLGMTEVELREKFPNFYERGEDNITVSDISDEAETYDLDSLNYPSDEVPNDDISQD